MNNTEIEKLISENEGLINAVIKKYFPEYINDEDIYQIGMIALWKAINMCEKGGKSLTSYAVKEIKHNILDEIKKKKSLKRSLPKGVELIELDKLFDDFKLKELFGKDEEGYEEVEIRNLLQTKDKLTKDVLNLMSLGYETNEIATILKTSKSLVLEIYKEIGKSYKS